MLIYLSQYCGFCFGVALAVKAAYEDINNNKQLLMFGDVVHNKSVIEELKEKGVQTINTIEELDNYTNPEVIIRAHGVPKKIINDLEEKNIKIIDKTCPKVKKIYEIVNNANKLGKDVIVIGNKEHPEIIGIAGWSNLKPTIINSLEEAKSVIPKMQFSKEGVCIVSQTTFNIDKFYIIVEYLKNNIEIVEVNNTICNSTENRQKDIDDLSKKAETVIIIGGKNSSNTTKLYEIALSNCKHTYHIEKVEEIDLTIFNKIDSVAIATGSSTPKELVIKLVEKIKEYCKENKIKFEIIN